MRFAPWARCVLDHGNELVILYEYPFNERVRTYLRLEHLLKRLGELVPRLQAVDHHFAFLTLFEIVDVLSRSDLKAEVLKDLERQKSLFQSYRQNPDISEAALDAVLAQLGQAFMALNQVVGKVGSAIADDEWLSSLRNRISIPGATCSFDLPAYHAWLHRPPADRQEALGHWIASITPLANAIYLLLKLVRATGVPKKVAAERGVFQQNLPAGRTFQLFRLRMDPALALVPEITGNRLLVSVRLLQQGEEGRLLPSQDDAGFEVSLCS